MSEPNLNYTEAELAALTSQYPPQIQKQWNEGLNAWEYGITLRGMSAVADSDLERGIRRAYFLAGHYPQEGQEG